MLRWWHQSSKGNFYFLQVRLESTHISYFCLIQFRILFLFCFYFHFVISACIFLVHIGHMLMHTTKLWTSCKKYSIHEIKLLIKQISHFHYYFLLLLTHKKCENLVNTSRRKVCIYCVHNKGLWHVRIMCARCLNFRRHLVYFFSHGFQRNSVIGSSNNPLVPISFSFHTNTRRSPHVSHDSTTKMCLQGMIKCNERNSNHSRPMRRNLSHWIFHFLM